MADPLDLLPHQPPMRLIDRVTDLVAGERATAGRRALLTDFYFDGHFPGDPIVPAVILVEMLAQTGGVAAATPDHASSDQPIRLRVAAIGPFKFPAAARPGAWLEAHARVAGRMGSLYKIDGNVTADGDVVAVGSVTMVKVS